MGQRILVFEKDTNFVRELESGFGRVGGQVQVVNDVDQAVSQAKAGQADLILVSVDAMATPGEAFLVCKRFKSDDQLARIPFVIMGGAAHAESLGSHKKLKRKADDYVDLPISADKLIQQLGPILPFDVSEASAEAQANDDNGTMGVDADIDAFADNAFDDLLMEEGPAPAASAPVEVAPVSQPSPGAAAQPAPVYEPPTPAAQAVLAPQQAAADRALERDLARVRTELEEARSAAQAAEERALAAERRAKTAEATRSSVAPPPTAGVSSRDYLELREQLNRKDKELLSLRDEVTGRDRKLLDASDRSLELERAQAELQDSLADVQRQLEETVAKVSGYEVDLEAAKKRRDDLSSRLNRADENVRRLERELDEARVAHSTELTERKEAHELQVRGLEEQTAADSARLRADHAAALERLATGHAEAMVSLEARARSELADTESAHENVLSSLRASHADELATVAQQHAHALANQKNHADSALAAALSQAADEKASALASASEDKYSALAAAAADHEQRLEHKLNEAEAAKQAALEGLRSELEARHAAQARERDDRHNKELAVLGRKLSEADAKAALLSQRIAELERSKAELEQSLLARIARLEADLAMRTEERDLTNNELSSARARIQSLEQTEAQLTQHVAGLEGRLFQAEQRIEQQTSKIATDDEILERVRKALGISVGLLEQQRQNA